MLNRSLFFLLLVLLGFQLFQKTDHIHPEQRKETLISQTSVYPVEPKVQRQPAFIKQEQEQVEDEEIRLSDENNQIPVGITEESFKKFKLSRKPFFVDYDKFYISRSYVQVRTQDFDPAWGKVVQSQSGFTIFQPANSQIAAQFPPVIVSASTGQPQYPTGQVVLKVPGAQNDRVQAMAQHKGLHLKESHSEIDTYFLVPSRKKDVFRVADELSALPGVEYARPEIIPALQIPL